MHKHLMNEMIYKDYKNNCEFIKDMIKHHQIACDMSESLITTTQNQRLMSLAHDIIWSQKAEIVNLRSIQTNYQYYSKNINDKRGTLSNVSTSLKHNNSETYGNPKIPITKEQEQSMERMMKNIKYTDEEFLEDMIEHHKIAVIMSRHVIDNKSNNPLLIYICRCIIWQQTLEIAQMKGLLNDYKTFKTCNTENTPIAGQWGIQDVRITREPFGSQRIREEPKLIKFEQKEKPIVSYYEPIMSTDKNIEKDKCCN